MYQSCKFKGFVTYRNYAKTFSAANGYTVYWDEEAKAPYAYNASRKLFATYDNARSVREKTRYAMNKGLCGIMFWELRQDDEKHTLLNAIHEVRKQQFINQPVALYTQK